MEIKLLSSNTVINKYVAEMRDVERQKDSMRFRRNIERIGELMAYEVRKTLHYAEEEVRTPLGIATVSLPQDKIVLGTILRAGLPMHSGLLNIFDDAETCFVSTFRTYTKQHEIEIHLCYAATPCLDDKVLIVADPMLATGNSMHQTLEKLLKYGCPSHIHILSIIGTQSGIDYLTHHALPAPTTLWVAAADPTLNTDSYIVPGLGDAGDLAFGNKN